MQHIYSRRVALTQLDSPASRKPAEKSALLVKAHKIIVGKFIRRHFNVKVGRKDL